MLNLEWRKSDPSPRKNKSKRSCHFRLDRRRYSYDLALCEIGILGNVRRINALPRGRRRQSLLSLSAVSSVLICSFKRSQMNMLMHRGQRGLKTFCGSCLKTAKQKHSSLRHCFFPAKTDAIQPTSTATTRLWTSSEKSFKRAALDESKRRRETIASHCASWARLPEYYQRLTFEWYPVLNR